jgi:hypothetical protein
MLNNGPFRVLLAALIAVGMHICCCQMSLLGMAHSEGADGAGAVSLGGCGHDHGESHGCEDGDETPESPRPGDHKCCGAHENSLTTAGARLELAAPALTGVLAAVAARPKVAAWRGLARADRGGAPPPETSLLRRHCALVV